ncbi:MAG: ribonuclease Y [Cytophagales bacterium]|nr:ribonuclease Y [Cytophagales bacterium]
MGALYLSIVIILVLGLGIVLGRIVSKKLYKQEEEKSKKKANFIIQEAKAEVEKVKRGKMVEVKEKFIQLKSDFDRDVSKKREELADIEKDLKNKEQLLSGKIAGMNQKEKALEDTKEELASRMKILKKKEEALERIKNESVRKLENIASLSAEEAKKQLVETLKEEAQSSASTRIKAIVDEAKFTATKEAKKIIITSIQRIAAEETIENCVTVFNIGNEEIKGKIIGREGRNIRTLEAATGVEIIVDDTPEAIIISCFDPVRREIARSALHTLVQDGRIHPASIEEIVAKTEKNMAQELIEIGERTTLDLGIHGVPIKLINMIGRMRFRSSYGQNLLQHSREVACLSATMAAELGLDAKLAKRAGLFHDIGKVSPEESELPHAILGMELAKKYNEHPEVCNAIGAHHNEIEMTCMIAPIVQACDAISGSRPGARREILEAYIKRLRDMEELTLSFEGVKKCYAIQAGRELRVMVDAAHINDEKASKLAFEISKKIEDEMQYPGQVRVTVIRETRTVAYAR